MIKNHLIHTLVCLFLLAACKAQTTQSTEATPQNKDMVLLEEVKSKNYTLKVGEKAYFSIDVHGSVGYWAECSITDEQVLALKETQTKAYNPQKENMPGGDKAKKTFIFEAKSVGTSQITVKRIYRNVTDKEVIFEIKVE